MTLDAMYSTYQYNDINPAGDGNIAVNAKPLLIRVQILSVNLVSAPNMQYTFIGGPKVGVRGPNSHSSSAMDPPSPIDINTQKR